MVRGLLLGLWIGLLVSSWLIATGTFRTADRSLGPEGRPDLKTRLSVLNPETQRVVLRHFAAEVNRFVFRTWAVLQAIVGIALLLVVWRTAGAGRTLVAAALVVLALQALWWGPGIESLGRSLDFVPRPLPPDVARRFGFLHGAYVLADLLKLLLLAAAAWAMRLPPPTR
jgi:hypothetical protein